MKESGLNKRCMDYVQRVCGNSVYYKHADKYTAGIPDCSLTWDGLTWWLEFKLLDPNESIHDQLDSVQLVELIKLEHASNGRAWVVAFRRANVKKLVLPKTVLYRPSALFNKRVPHKDAPSSEQCFLQDAKVFGTAWCEGYNYAAIAGIIVQAA